MSVKKQHATIGKKKKLIIQQWADKAKCYQWIQ